MAITVKTVHRPEPETTSYLRAALKGMALTFKHLLTPPVTRQYPKEKREPFPGSRGLPGVH